MAGIKEQLQSELALEPYSRRPLHAGLLLQEVDNKSLSPQDPPALTKALEELQTVLFKHYPFLEERGLLEEKVLLEERGQNPLTYFDESLLPRVVFFTKGVSGEVSEAANNVVLEQAIQIFLGDWHRFASVARFRKCTRQFNKLTNTALKKQTLPFFNSTSDDWVANYFRENRRKIPNRSLFPWSPEQHPLFDSLLTAFSERRNKIISDALALFENNSEEVNDWIAELKDRKLKANSSSQSITPPSKTLSTEPISKLSDLWTRITLPSKTLSTEQVAVIRSVFQPYLNTAKIPPMSELTSSRLSKLLIAELTRPYNNLSKHLQPQNLLLHHLPLGYESTGTKITSINNVQALVPLQDALAKAQKKTPELPSGNFMERLGVEQQDRFLALQSPDTIQTSTEGIIDILNLLSRHYLHKQEVKAYRSRLNVYIQEVAQADSALIREKAIQERLGDFDVLEQVAQNLGLTQEYQKAFGAFFAPTKPPNKFSSLGKRKEIYEQILRQVSANPEQYPKFDRLCLDNRLFDLLVDVFSADRRKKVREVLRLLATTPSEAVVTVIEELRRAKP